MSAKVFIISKKQLDKSDDENFNCRKRLLNGLISKKDYEGPNKVMKRIIYYTILMTTHLEMFIFLNS